MNLWCAVSRNLFDIMFSGHDLIMTDRPFLARIFSLDCVSVGSSVTHIYMCGSSCFIDCIRIGSIGEVMFLLKREEERHFSIYMNDVSVILQN